MTQDFNNNVWEPEISILESKTPEVILYPGDVTVNWVFIESLMTKACEIASDILKKMKERGIRR